MRLYWVRIKKINHDSQWDEQSDDGIRLVRHHDTSYSRSNMYITKYKINRDLCIDIHQKMEDAEKKTSYIWSAVPGNKNRIEVTKQTSLGLRFTDVVIKDMETEIYEFIDESVPEYDGYIAIHEGIHGLYSERYECNGVTIYSHYSKNNNERWVEDYTMSKTDEQDLDICYQVEEYLRHKGENLDNRYTIE